MANSKQEQKPWSKTCRKKSAEVIVVLISTRSTKD